MKLDRNWHLTRLVKTHQIKRFWHKTLHGPAAKLMPMSFAKNV